MLNPSGWWVVQAPVDLRCGMDRLLLQIQVLGGDPFAGGAWVFRNRCGTRIKLLYVDVQGVWLAVRRLHRGRFVWPCAGEATWGMSAEQFAWLSAGVDWQRLSVKKVLARTL